MAVNYTSVLMDDQSRVGQVTDKEDDLILQPIWSAALRHSQYTSSPTFPICIYAVFLLLLYTPCTVLDLLSSRFVWIRQYKIQQVDSSWRTLCPAFMVTFWNHLLYVVPFSMAQWAWTPCIHLPPSAPTLWEFSWHMYVSLIIVDFEYYLWHVCHHKSRFLYRHIHSLHHQYSSVNSWVTQYSHPWELFSLGIFTTTAPWILQAHPFTNWAFTPFMLAVSIEDHCGYDFPLMPHRWAPFWGGSRKHDMHHQRPLTNFQPFFNWFDRLFGHEYPSRHAKSGVGTAVKLKN